MWLDVIRELFTPSNQMGPAARAYLRAVTGVGHTMIGALLVSVFGVDPNLWLQSALAATYFLTKEVLDIRRGGGRRDSLEDTGFVFVGTAYTGEWIWPATVLVLGLWTMIKGIKE